MTSTRIEYDTDIRCVTQRIHSDDKSLVYIEGKSRYMIFYRKDIEKS
jgi:hypothetical protein